MTETWIDRAGAVVASLRTLIARAVLLATAAFARPTTLLGSTRELASDNRRILLKVDEIRWMRRRSGCGR